MNCSGCGKDIPFTGSVCPYCQRDKSKDQMYTVVSFIFGSIAAFIGYKFFGFWGAVGGCIGGCFVAAIMTLRDKSRPPQVQIVDLPTSSIKEGSVTDKLAQLKDLHSKGLLTDEEFSSKKAEILNKF